MSILQKASTVPVLTEASVPQNCHFEVKDAEEPWDHRQKFDNVHGRAMLSCFKDPCWITAQAFSILRPGGYFEIRDPQMPIIAIDDTMNGTSPEKWGHVVCEAAEKLGRSVKSHRNYGRYMEQAGFVDIVEKHFSWLVDYG